MTDVITLGVDSPKDIQQEIIDISKKTVLIIEDLGEMRSMLKSLITSMGYSNIDIEQSGQAALKRILERSYDVVLSDYNLGGTVDGQQILEASRKTYSQDYSNIFIMITADTAYESVVSALEFQPDSYLVKPFTPAAFFRRFERVKKQKNIFQTINNARKESDFETMESQAKVIMEQHPNYASQCLKTIGESLYARGHYKEAKSHYLLVIKQNKQLAWAHFGIALCEFKLGAIVAAAAKLEQTINLSRHYMSAYDLLSDAYEELGNLEDAQTTMINALKVSPRSLDRVIRLAEISMQLQDWETAEHSYAKVIRLTKETSHEKVEFYYEYLTCLTNLMSNGSENSRLVSKSKRTLIRLRSFGKGNPAAISNSFRIEIKQHLARNHTGEAIKSWQQWNHLIETEQASPLTEAQKHTLKKRLGLL